MAFVSEAHCLKGKRASDVMKVQDRQRPIPRVRVSENSGLLQGVSNYRKAVSAKDGEAAKVFFGVVEEGRHGYFAETMNCP